MKQKKNRNKMQQAKGWIAGQNRRKQNEQPKMRQKRTTDKKMEACRRKREWKEREKGKRNRKPFVFARDLGSK